LPIRSLFVGRCPWCSQAEYAAPAQFPFFGGALPAVTRGLRGEISAVAVQGRVDATWRAADGRTFNMGAASLGQASRRLAFGGGF
jgi:hypothetical protein